MVRACALIAAVVGLACCAGVAEATPCGASRCHLFRAADGADGAVTAGPDGAMWFAGRGFLGRMTLGGKVTRVAAPAQAGSDVAGGADGAVWFTTGDGRIGRVGADGAVSLRSTGFGVGPAALAAGPDGAMWFAVGTTAGRVGADGRITRYSLPVPAGGPESLAAGPDGALWLLSFAGQVVRISTTGQVRTFATPFPSSLGGLAAGPDGGLWFTVPDSKRVGRISPSTGRVTAFRTSQRPRHITAGPSYAIWFTMSAPGRRQSVVRLVPAGFQTFFQVRGAIRGIAAGGNDGIFLTKGNGIQRLTPFLGARPIRSRALRVNRFAGSASLRLACPKFDLVFCAGKIKLRYRGRLLASTRFSQRVNDAPATRIVLNAYGRRLARSHARLRVRMTIVQHDQGGTARRSTQNLYLRRR